MSQSRAPLRPLLPRPQNLQHEANKDGDGNEEERQTKRFAISSACNNCRARKSKCDGSRPRCSRCVKKNVDCQYDHAQGLTPRQGDRQRLSNYRTFLELLHEGSEADVASALNKVRESDNMDAAVDAIVEAQLLITNDPGAGESNLVKNASKGPSAASWNSKRRRIRSPLDNPSFVFERQYMKEARVGGAGFHVSAEFPGRILPLSKWTTVSDDDKLLSHLYDMALTWDNPSEHLFCRPMLEQDIVDLDPSSDDNASTSFCSQFLINALLAIGCIYSRDPATLRTLEDTESRGRKWADEAERLLQYIQEPSLTLLQGVYLLFMYEGNVGMGTKAVQYFHRTTEIYNSLNDQGLAQVSLLDDPASKRQRQGMSWCLWGTYCLEWRPTEALGLRKQLEKPKIGKLWRDADFPLRHEDCLGYWWCPYPISLQHQPWLQVEIREADVALSEICEEVLSYLHPLDGEESPLSNLSKALELYDAVVKLRLNLPHCLRFEVTVLPAAILLHVYFEVVILAILRPFTGLTQEQFGRFNPRERCVTHASNLVSVIWAFRAFGQIRCEYYLTHPLATCAFILLAGCEDQPVHMDLVARVCQCLHQMRPMLPLATDVLSGVRAAFNRYGLAIPEYLGGYFQALHHRADGLMHHAFAALLPSQAEGGGISIRAEMQLQALLEEFGSTNLD